jgi:hypothetical protein
MVESLGSCGRGAHAIFTTIQISLSSDGAQKKWLAIAAANHLSDQPGTGSHRARAKARTAYAVNELPQPQLRAAWGF